MANTAIEMPYIVTKLANTAIEMSHIVAKLSRTEAEIPYIVDELLNREPQSGIKAPHPASLTTHQAASSFLSCSFEAVFRISPSPQSHG